MFSASRKNSSQEDSFIIASPHTIYRHRSDSLAENQEVRNLMFKTIKNPDNSRQSLIGAGNRDTVLRILERYNLSLAELHEVEAFFHLLLRDLTNPFKIAVPNGYELPGNYTETITEDFTQELYESLRGNIRPIEKTILSSLFLNKDQILAEFQYVHDFMHGNLYLRRPVGERRSIPSKH